MATKKPKIVIIGAGMAGLTAANKLYASAESRELFDLCIVEGGTRIGGRINTSEFGGDRIEMGATWIHGIGGSPIHRIAQENDSLQSEQPWECMDGFLDDPLTLAEGGYELSPSLVEPVSNLFKKLMDFAQGKQLGEDGSELADLLNLSSGKSCCACTKNGVSENLSVGSFLRRGLDAYWNSVKDQEEEEEVKNCGENWSRKSLEEAIFAMHENTQRTYTSAGDLHTLDYNAESEYVMFPGDEITIAKGYISIIESLASVLPPGLIHLGRKVNRIDWQSENYAIAGRQPFLQPENGHDLKPVKLHFCDGSTMYADHVIVTVSLGVLKQGIREDTCLFNPPLPKFKTDAISRLGYGVVNKLFLQLSREHDHSKKFPSLQMVFHQEEDSKSRQSDIPWWMRRTATLCPIYSKSNVLLSWFAGEEAIELESLEDEEILNGMETTISNLVPNSLSKSIVNGKKADDPSFSRVLKTRWGTDPLFLGSYSYVAVGSSGDDLDTMAEPLPARENDVPDRRPLQILFAGEATHRTHYSTTHGAYFSGLREANRLLQHYHCIDNNV